MSRHDFYADKIEEALQLLSAHNELVEKQNTLIEEYLARMASMQAEHNLSAYLHNGKEDNGAFGY